MGDELSRSQQILMWELFAAGGEKLNKDIVPKTVKKDREALIKQGLIETQKRGQTFLIKLKDDKGWRWISDSDPFPIAEGEKRVTAERRLLQSLVRGFKRYARQQRSTIQQLFRATDEASGPSEPSEQASKSEDRTKAHTSRGGSEVENAIADAFFSIAGRPAKGNIRLSALRAKLKHFDRSDVDAALVSMWRAKKANLMNLDNPRDIEAEGDAALVSGIHTFHVVRIAE